jgi:hypothetical protein
LPIATIDGFVFDYTGHLLHLRDPRAIALVDELWPDTSRSFRASAGFARGGHAPVPVPGEPHGLPKPVVADCILGAAEALAGTVPDDPPCRSGIGRCRAGKGISEAFMFPITRSCFAATPRR